MKTLTWKAKHQMSSNLAEESLPVLSAAVLPLALLSGSKSIVCCSLPYGVFSTALHGCF